MSISETSTIGKHDLAATLRQRRPLPGHYGVIESGVRTLHLIRRDDFPRRKYRQDFCIKRVVVGGHPSLQSGHGIECIGDAVFILDLYHDHQRHMTGIGIRPGFYFLQTVIEADAGTIRVNIGYVHDLEAGSQQARMINAAIKTEGRHGTIRRRRCKTIRAPSGIGPDIKLELTHAKRQLLRQCGMTVIEQGPQNIRNRIIGKNGIKRITRRNRPAVIAVVATQKLDLVNS